MITLETYEKMLTLQEYLQEQKEELKLLYSSDIETMLIDEYYNNICEYMRNNNSLGLISKKVYNSLTQGQKYHFDKHFNYRGDKVI